MAVPTIHVKPEDLTPEIVSQYVAYDPETGHFTWVKSRCTGKAANGDRAGSMRGKYWSINLLGHRYKAHRLAWFCAYGRWPTGWMDHANGDRLDNRITNLREATPRENNANKATRSGHLRGTRRYHNRWSASIKRDGKPIHLGMFSTQEEAALAYHRAAAEIHGEFATTRSLFLSRSNNL